MLLVIQSALIAWIVRQIVLRRGPLWSEAAGSPGLKRSMSPLVLAGAALFIFLGSYGLARAADIWQSSSGGLIVRDLDLVKKVNQVEVNYQPVEEIKVFNSLEEVSKAYQILKPNYIRR